MQRCDRPHPIRPEALKLCELPKGHAGEHRWGPRPESLGKRGRRAA